MFSLSRNVLGFAVASSLTLLTVSATPAIADEMVQSLGPVSPHQPILAAVGGKHVIAFFAPDNGQCQVQVVMWNADDLEARSAGGVRIGLSPGQTASIDGSGNESFTLKCGDRAETLSSLGAKPQFALR
jgi:hypothetical protein